MAIFNKKLLVDQRLFRDSLPHNLALPLLAVAREVSPQRRGDLHTSPAGSGGLCLDHWPSSYAGFNHLGYPSYICMYIYIYISPPFKMDFQWNQPLSWAGFPISGDLHIGKRVKQSFSASQKIGFQGVADLARLLSWLLQWFGGHMWLTVARPKKMQTRCNLSLAFWSDFTCLFFDSFCRLLYLEFLKMLNVTVKLLLISQWEFSLFEESAGNGDIFLRE